MDIYLGRQRVIGLDTKVFAYELFYREGSNNSFPYVCSNKATERLILNNGLDGGVYHVTDGSKAMVNFCEKSLLKGLVKELRPEEVVVEILETVNPTDEIYNICCELLSMGYEIALDDFVYSEKWDRFLSIVSMVKFDVIETPLETISHTLDKINMINATSKRPRIKLLAEKVETSDVYEKAKDLGFDYFQGWLFGRTELMSYDYKQVISL